MLSEVQQAGRQNRWVDYPTWCSFDSFCRESILNGTVLWYAPYSFNHLSFGYHRDFFYNQGTVYNQERNVAQSLSCGYCKDNYQHSLKNLPVLVFCHVLSCPTQSLSQFQLRHSSWRLLSLCRLYIPIKCLLHLDSDKEFCSFLIMSQLAMGSVEIAFTSAIHSVRIESYFWYVE